MNEVTRVESYSSGGVLYDVVLRSGRVVDPETGLDGVRDVGIIDDRIAAISAERLRGRVEVDAAGCIVCAGFIDLHSHGQEIPEHRLQALDGVTTSMDLEAGRYPVSRAYERAQREGRPLNFGYATSWAGWRMSALGGMRLQDGIWPLLRQLGLPEWQGVLGSGERYLLEQAMLEELGVGAIGVGMLLGYAQDVRVEEVMSVARIAALAGAPMFVHARDLVEVRPDTLRDGAEEIVETARLTGVSMHYCHVNSTSTRYVDRVLSLVERVRSEGSAVSTEAYPYGAGATAIGASFLAPERLAERGLTPHSIRYAPTGERVGSAERLYELRRRDPGGLAIVEYLRDDVPEEFALVERALAAPSSAVASDAMPIHWSGAVPCPYDWPLTAGARTHPRSAGTYSRLLRLVREGNLFSWVEAVRRCSLLPAEILQGSVPAMARKGRMQTDCDADVVVFDPETVTDRATYIETVRPSKGVRYLLVNGAFVVREGELESDALPGRAIRR